MAKNERQAIKAVVGANLRWQRKQANLTQEGLAAAAGLSRATVAAIELGRYESVELSSLEALAAALKCPEFEFLVRFEQDSQIWTDFSSSEWKAIANATEEERRWLTSLPTKVWDGRSPKPRIVFELLELRRRHLA